MLELGFIVTTTNDTHKKVVKVLGEIVTLEFYSETGREFENVSASKCHFVSDKVTKQFLEMKSLFQGGRKSFYSEREHNRQRTIKTNASKLRYA